MEIYSKLKLLGLTLPPPPPPFGLYVPVRRVGNLLFTAGALPVKDGNAIYTGKVGAEVTIEQAQEAAFLCALNTLARVEEHMKSLELVTGVVKLNGYVASAPGFNKQGMVMNAASKLFIDIFGAEEGQHARTSVGVSELPYNMPVEMEMIFILGN